MLRINLLPGYVAQRRITKSLVVLFSILIAATVVSLGATWAGYTRDANQYQGWAKKAAAAQAQIDGLNTQATTVQQSVGPINDRLAWVKKVQEYNVAQIGVFQDLFKYTPTNILYNQMTLNGTTLTITGYTPTLADLGRYLLVMYKYPGATSVELTTPIPSPGTAYQEQPQFVQVASAKGGKLPGYHGLVHNFTILKGRIIAVNTNGAGTGTAAGAPTGFGGGGAGFGMAGRMGGPPPGLAGMAGRGFGGAGAGFGGPAGAMGGPAGGMGTGGLARQAATGHLYNPAKDGFPFTVALELKPERVPTAPPPPEAAVNIEIQGGGGGGGMGGPMGGGMRGGPMGGGGGPMMMGGRRAGGGPPMGAMSHSFGFGGPPQGAGGPPAFTQPPAGGPPAGAGGGL